MFALRQRASCSISGSIRLLSGNQIIGINSSVRFTTTMSSFPPPQIKQIVTEVAALLKERKETVSVAETV